MRNQRTRLLVLVATLAALFALVPQGIASAHSIHSNLPLASCSGKGCNGVNPGGSGCDGSNAVTLLSTPIKYNGTQIGLVELRWSNNCSTNWIRIDDYVGSSTAGWIRDETCAYYGPPTQDYSTCPPTEVDLVSSPWTYMLYLPHDNACGKGQVLYNGTWVTAYVNQLQWAASGGTGWGNPCGSP